MAFIVVDSFHDRKEAQALVKKLKAKGKSARIHVHNPYTWPTYTVRMTVKD